MGAGGWSQNICFAIEVKSDKMLKRQKKPLYTFSLFTILFISSEWLPFKRKAAIPKHTQFYVLALISHHMCKFAITKALCISPEQSPFAQVRHPQKRHSQHSY